MDIREKLTELIESFFKDDRTYYDFTADVLAGVLISHGVMVQECGEWVWRGGIPWCSVCGEMPPGYSYDGDANTSPYCPSCGARLFPRSSKGE